MFTDTSWMRECRVTVSPIYRWIVLVLTSRIFTAVLTLRRLTSVVGDLAYIGLFFFGFGWSDGLAGQLTGRLPGECANEFSHGSVKAGSECCLRGGPGSSFWRWGYNFVWHGKPCRCRHGGFDELAQTVGAAILSQLL